MLNLWTSCWLWHTHNEAAWVLFCIDWKVTFMMQICFKSTCWHDFLPSIIVTGSSTLGRRMLGPNTVARFWTLILLSFECDWTSSRNLRGQNQKRKSFLGMQNIFRQCWLLHLKVIEANFTFSFKNIQMIKKKDWVTIGAEVCGLSLWYLYSRRRQRGPAVMQSVMSLPLMSRMWV